KISMSTRAAMASVSTSVPSQSKRIALFIVIKESWSNNAANLRATAHERQDKTQTQSEGQDGQAAYEQGRTEPHGPQGRGAGPHRRQDQRRHRGHGKTIAPSERRHRLHRRRARLRAIHQGRCPGIADIDFKTPLTVNARSLSSVIPAKAGIHDKENSI